MNTALLIITTTVSTLLLGTLWKGLQTILWERCHKPVLLWAGKHLGAWYQKRIDALYLIISTRPPSMPGMSLDFLLCAVGIGYGFNRLIWPKLWPYLYKELEFKDSLNPSLNEEQSLAVFHDQIYYYSYCVISGFALLVLLALIYSWIWYGIIEYRTSYFNFLMSLARPLISAEESLKYEARFASMSCQADYKAMVAELRKAIDNPALTDFFYTRRMGGK